MPISIPPIASGIALLLLFTTNPVERFVTKLRIDPCTKEVLQYNLKKIHKYMNITTIHVTHDFNEALYLADRIAVMSNGRILQKGL